jgi:hypothetical protein
MTVTQTDNNMSVHLLSLSFFSVMNRRWHISLVTVLDIGTFMREHWTNNVLSYTSVIACRGDVRDETG